MKGLVIAAVFLLGCWLAYLKGKETAEDSTRNLGPGYKPGRDHSVYTPPRRTPPPPPPPCVTQHKEGCPQRPLPRIRVCGGCGQELKHKHPKPPRPGD